ncbi:MAG TPA: helix-turn-helix transcriptional regulator [Mycobacteriales bacterium]|nr:helix-turn-helix transcriptional regulator [Mycobacteriales bacterium]
MTETFGEALRRSRKLAGLSQPALAARIHFSQSMLSKVETGAESASYDFAKACDAALNADGKLLKLAAAAARAASVTGEELEAWEIADALTHSSVSPTALDMMERAVTGYATCYPSTPPEVLLVPVRQQLRRLRHALTQPQTLQVRGRTVRLVGVLSGIAGNLWLDVDRADQAVTFFELGRLAGSEAEDGDLTAWVLATHSIAPFFAGRPAEAAELLDEANELARRSCGSRRRAWIASLRARAYGAAGNRAVALSCLDSAREAIATATEPPHGTDFFDGPRLDGIAGSTFLLLHATEQARQLLTQALDRRSATDAKGRALITLDLAAARVVDAEPEEAARLAGQALDLARGAVVRPIVARALAVRAGMQPWEGTTAVARLDAQLGEIAYHPDPEE